MAFCFPRRVPVCLLRELDSAPQYQLQRGALPGILGANQLMGDSPHQLSLSLFPPLCLSNKSILSFSLLIYSRKWKQTIETGPGTCLCIP